VDDSVVERVLLDMVDGLPIEDLLDVGTGTGRMLELFSGHLKSGEGIDLSREMLNVARANLDRAGHHNCAVRQADMYQLPFPAGSFDAVTMHQVLHFLDRPGRAVGEAVRVLRPGGWLLLVDFAPHGQESLRDEHAHRRLGFDEREIAAWFDVNNMTLQKSDHLAGDPLTVSVWLGKKNDGASSTQRATAT